MHPIEPATLVPREAWGATARGATPTTHPIGTVRGVTLHWEGPELGEFAHGACAGKVAGIQRFHKETRGWADIAYTAIVCPHGYVFEGRGPRVRTAANGTDAGNAGWYAVCYLGGVGDPLTDAGRAGLALAVSWLRHTGAGDAVNGHSDHKATACPGPQITAWIAAGMPLPDAPVRVDPPDPTRGRLIDQMIADGRTARTTAGPSRSRKLGAALAALRSITPRHRRGDR